MIINFDNIQIILIKELAEVEILVWTLSFRFSFKF